MGTITVLLGDVRKGRTGAADRLFELVYDDLKAVARSHLRKHGGGAFHATDLVSAAYERLAAKGALGAADRRQFFFVLSRAMHDVLVEEVRAVQAIKRGGGRARVPLVEVAIDDATRHVAILDLQTALGELGSVDPTAARVVVHRFYGGLTLEETAEALDLTFAVVRRHWEYAKAWLHERLSHPDADPDLPRPE